MKRTIFIGDVHGCIDELKQMIKCLKLKMNDRVILLGDLINKGKYSIEVIDYVYQQGFESLMGNHEYHYLYTKDRFEEKQKLRESIGEEKHEWIKRFPIYLKEKKFIAVHGGILPENSIEKTKPFVLLTLRFWKHKAWYHYYKGEIPVFYGHWAKQGLNIRKYSIGLDSGCVYGNYLSAYCLETQELFQIKAKEVYCKVKRKSNS